MAITFDSTANATATDGNPITFALTVGAGANRLLAVGVGSRSIGMAVSGITFNGNPLTKAIDIDDGIFNQSSIWYLINPDATTANVVVTFNAGTPVAFAACAVSLFGVAQSSPVDDTDSNSGSSSTASVSGLTTTVDGCAILDAVYMNGGGVLTMTADTNRVERMNVVPSGLSGASTIITKATAGSSTMEWTALASVQWAQTAAAFKPAGAAGNPWYYYAQQ